MRTAVFHCCFMLNDYIGQPPDCGAKGREGPLEKRLNRRLE
jgi:hypothetical protein